MFGLTSAITRFTAAVIAPCGRLVRIRNCPPASGRCSCEVGKKAIGPNGSRRSWYLVSLTKPTISYAVSGSFGVASTRKRRPTGLAPFKSLRAKVRSEEHTSELQSQSNLVCRLLLEKKKKKVLD